MTLQVEVTPEGLLKVVSPKLEPGEVITLNTGNSENYKTNQTGKGKWSELKKIVDEAAKLDIPRRTHEEILREIHTMWGYE